MEMKVTSTDTIKHIPYEEWVTQAEIPDEDCLDCDGTGEITCFHCGQSMDCETCNGTGKTVNAKHLYKEQVKHDEEPLEKWVNAVTVQDY